MIYHIFAFRDIRESLLHFNQSFIHVISDLILDSTSSLLILFRMTSMVVERIKQITCFCNIIQIYDKKKGGQVWIPAGHLWLLLSGLVSSVRRALASKLRGPGFKSRSGTTGGPVTIIMWGARPGWKLALS